MIRVTVEAAVKVIEDAAEEQRNDEKEEADSGNGKKHGKRVQFQDVHAETLQTLNLPARAMNDDGDRIVSADEDWC